VPAPGAFAIAFTTPALRWLVERYAAFPAFCKEQPRGENASRGVVIPWGMVLSDLDEYGGGWR